MAITTTASWSIQRPGFLTLLLLLNYPTPLAALAAPSVARCGLSGYRAMLAAENRDAIPFLPRTGAALRLADCLLTAETRLLDPHRFLPMQLQRLLLLELLVVLLD